MNALHQDRVAIVGMGGIFPDAPDLEQFWTNIRDAHAATRAVPTGRWELDPGDAYDPRVALADHVYSTSGCFVEGFSLDPTNLAVDPALLDRLDPTFHLALHAARAAWNDAKTWSLDRTRVGVVFGNIVLPTESASSIARETLGRTFEEAMGYVSKAVRPFEPLNTRVAGLPASLVAQALRLGGGAYTIDAACASSLYALKLAADELLEGRADAMITGGLSRPDPLYTQMGFSQLRALSPSGVASPFGSSADGLVVGEGAGMFVLKRLSDAIDQGDTIYGVIAGVGLSNDVDGGLLAPQSEGQLRAMRQAYQQAGWLPTDVDLVECHATGTPVGDAVEFASLRDLWGENHPGRTRCVIGSVKSNVGHALTAAGAAGLLKVLLALKNQTLPPTAGFVEPSPALKIEESPFRILAEAEPWEARSTATPRRVALSGFGFGGINAHALIEEYRPEQPSVPEPLIPSFEPIAIIGLAAHYGRFEGIEAFQHAVLGGTANHIAIEEDQTGRWWGAAESSWLCSEGWGNQRYPGERLREVTLPADRFRIPPRELKEMLPQQSLMLRLASEAIADAGWDGSAKLRCGVIIGLGLDLNTTNFHVRWSLLNKAREWNVEHGLGLSEEGINEWVEPLRNAFGPPLTANRTMGALGSIVASRVAREFRLGGSSFTVSSEETSSLRALDVAARMLGRHELDSAIVGGVDLIGDLRSSLAESKLNPGLPLVDGGAVVILRRLSDAERDADRIYAVIRGVGVASDSNELLSIKRALGSSGIDSRTITLHEGSGGELAGEATSLEPSCAFGETRRSLGFSGAASGAASLVKAVLCLHQQILPATSTARGSPRFSPKHPQFWLRDRIEGPRRALVGSSGIDGNVSHVLLEGYEPTSGTTTPDRCSPLGELPVGLFAVESNDLPGLVEGVDQLAVFALDNPSAGIGSLAKAWWKLRQGREKSRLGLAIVAEDRATLLGQVELARRRLGGEPAFSTRQRPGDRLAFSDQPLGPQAPIGFVFPGMGNHYPGMGRELAAAWPEVLRTQDAANDLLQSQMASGTYWNEDPPTDLADHRSTIFGQVSFGTLMSDLLRLFGVKPAAMIGYSLGETTALFASGAWSDRDTMFRRFDASNPLPLPTSLDLATPLVRPGISRKRKKSSGLPGSWPGRRRLFGKPWKESVGLIC